MQLFASFSLAWFPIFSAYDEVVDPSESSVYLSMFEGDLKESYDGSHYFSGNPLPYLKDWTTPGNNRSLEPGFQNAMKKAAKQETAVWNLKRIGTTEKKL